MAAGPPKPLSARQIRFVQRWVETGNATRSFIDAGFPCKNENTAHALSKRLLRRATVRAYAAELRAAAADAARVTVEELARDFRRAATADLRRIFGPDGEVLPPREWPDELASAVAGIEVEEMHDWEKDPETGQKRKVKVGLKWKVKLENKTEARKVLADWRRMTGNDKAVTAGGPATLVIVKGPAHVAPPADAPEELPDDAG